MFVRAYLRASTKEQDADRARAELDAFANHKGMSIAAYYTENESGASLKRPELFRLLRDCQAGDVLLTEQVDRLSRLDERDWNTLKREISDRQICVVALDLPTSHTMLSAIADTFTQRMFAAINAMMLDMLAAIARKDYDDRRRRQDQGIAKAKAAGRYKGRPENEDRNAAIIKMLVAGHSWNDIVAASNCSRSTLARLARRIKQPADQLAKRRKANKPQKDLAQFPGGQELNDTGISQ